MNTEQAKERAAQPANEELKKHGDQLKKQVDAVADGEPADTTPRTEEKGDKD
ncbi:MAG TPA: hypothetical protein VGE12_04745 [Noviherbaspirillum sp.]